MSELDRLDEFRAVLGSFDRRRLADELSASEDAELESGGLEDILARNRYEALTELDPYARLPRRLDLRVAGEHVRAGALDATITSELLHAVTTEVSAAASAQNITYDVSLDLVGVGHGSAILQLVPTAPEDVAAIDQMPIVVDPLDDVVATVVDLHREAESGGDLRRFGGSEPLMRGLRDVVRTLDKYDVTLDLRWRSAVGRSRTATLGPAAREHVRGLWEEHVVQRTISVSGLVVSLDINGKVAIKGHRRRIEIVVPGENAIINLGLQLGSTVHFRVEEQKKRNRLGIESPAKYTLVGLNSKTEPALPGMPEAPNARPRKITKALGSAARRPSEARPHHGTSRIQFAAAAAQDPAPSKLRAPAKKTPATKTPATKAGKQTVAEKAAAKKASAESAGTKKVAAKKTEAKKKPGSSAKGQARKS